VDALHQGLQTLGWTEGRNIRIDYRWAGPDPDRIGAFAAELVALAPDAILAHSPPVLAALQQKTIPVVFVQVADPITAGFVVSLAHPGGNITGFTSFEDTMSAKWLELLKAITPRITRVGIIRNPATASASAYIMPAIEAAAPSYGIQLVIADARLRYLRA
jgi:putative ABC transport system substrate-binding protein